MKSIPYTDEFLTAQGQPFYIPDPDVRRQREAREAAKQAGLAAYDVPQIEATFAALIVWFVDNIPHERDEKGQPGRKITIQDAGHAYSVIKAFKSAQNGKIDLEDTVYKWLLDTLDIDGTTAFRGTTAAVIKERLQAVS